MYTVLRVNMRGNEQWEEGKNLRDVGDTVNRTQRAFKGKIRISQRRKSPKV
jgi:hypothetical protein